MFTYNFTISYYNNLGVWTTDSLGDNDSGSYSIYKNSTRVYTGFSEVISRLQGELNSGLMEVLSTSDETFPIFSIITFTCVDGDDTRKQSYYVGKDNVEPVNKKDKIYRHTLELIDLTKKLEKKVLETICFTQPTDLSEYQLTIWDCLQRLWRIYETTTSSTLTQTQIDNYLNNETRIANLPNENNGKLLDYIDTDLYNKLQSVNAPELVLSNLTLREAFDEIFKYVNAISVVDYNVLTNKFTLTCKFFNETKDLIDYSNSIEGYSDSHNIDDYDSNIHNFLSNQITENYNKQSSLMYPSSNTFAPVITESQNYRITDNNFGCLLPEPIYTINNLYIRTSIEYTTQLESTAVTVNSLALDITEHCVETYQYNTLPYSSGTVVGGIKKNNCVHYTKGERFISLNDSFNGFVFANHKVTFACLESLIKYFNNLFSGNEPTWINVDLVMGESVDSDTRKITATLNWSSVGESYYVASWVGTGTFHLELVAYRVNYMPIYNTRLITEKSDTEKVKLDTSGISNQRAKVVSLQNVSLNDRSNIDRVGNESIEISLRHKHLNELYDEGDYTNDGYIVTKCEYIYYDNYIIGKYELTKNYSKLSEYIGINSEYRPYEIPSGNNVYQRKVALRDFVYITSTDWSFETTTPFLTSNAMREYITSIYNDNLETSSLNMAVNNVIINVDNGKLISTYDTIASGTNRLYMACASDGGANNILFHFSFDDNITAGYVEYDNGDGKLLMQKAPYTTNGRTCKIDLQFVNGYTNTPTNKVPLTDITGIDYTNKTVATINNVYLLKDPAEIIDFTYEVCAVNKSPFDVILGKDFSAKNNLVYDIDNVIYYLYGTNTKIARGETIIPSSATQVQELSTSNCSISQSGNEYTFTVSGATTYNYYYIGNRTNNIFMLATTKSILTNGLKFTFSGKRTDIKDRY